MKIIKTKFTICLLFASSLFSSTAIIKKGWSLTKPYFSSAFQSGSLSILNQLEYYAEDYVVPFIPQKLYNSLSLINDKFNEKTQKITNVIISTKNIIIPSQIQEPILPQNDQNNIEINLNTCLRYIFNAVLLKRKIDYSLFESIVLQASNANNKITTINQFSTAITGCFQNSFFFTLYKIIKNPLFQNFVFAGYSKPFNYIGNPFLYSILAIPESLPLITVQNFSNNNKKSLWSLSYILSLLTIKLYLGTKSKPDFYIKNIIITAIVMGFGVQYGEAARIYVQNELNEIIEENSLISTLPLQLSILAIIQYFSYKILKTSLQRSSLLIEIHTNPAFLIKSFS